MSTNALHMRFIPYASPFSNEAAKSLFAADSPVSLLVTRPFI